MKQRLQGICIGGAVLRQCRTYEAPTSSEPRRIIETELSRPVVEQLQIIYKGFIRRSLLWPAHGLENIELEWRSSQAFRLVNQRGYSKPAKQNITQFVVRSYQ